MCFVWNLVVPIEDLPDSLKESMSAAWNHKQKNQKILDERNKN